MKKKYFRLEFLTVFICALILIKTLILEPVIGVADNGDFIRIMNSTGLGYFSEDFTDKYFEYFNREYKIIPTEKMEGGYFSTEIFLVKISKTINNLFLNRNGIFDIRFLALIYSLIFLVSIYLVLKYSKQDIPILNYLITLLIIIMFADLGYISYFNSLYGEALSFTSLLLFIGLSFKLSKQSNPQIITLIAFFAAAILLTGAKAQNAPFGLILAIFGVSMIRLRKDVTWKSIIFISCSLLLLVPLISYTSISENIKVCNKYQSVFHGVLKDSPTPKNDLRELGINEDLAVLAGTHFFMKEYPIDINTPLVMNEIRDKVNPAKIALFYLKHPSRFVEKLNVSAKNGFKIVQGFGNYEKTDNPEFRITAEDFRIWSNFKLRHLPHSLTFVIIIFTLFYSILLIMYLSTKKSSDKLYLETFAIVGIIALIQFVVPIIGDGEADLSKHLFLFNVCFDIIFLFCIVWAAKKIFKKAV